MLFQGTGLETVTAGEESASHGRRRSRVSPIVYAANFATFRYTDLMIHAQGGPVYRWSRCMQPSRVLKGAHPLPRA